MKHSDFHCSKHYSEIKRKLNSSYCTSLLLLFKENSVSSEIWKKKKSLKKGRWEGVRKEGKSKLKNECFQALLFYKVSNWTKWPVSFSEAPMIFESRISYSKNDNFLYTENVSSQWIHQMTCSSNKLKLLLLNKYEYSFDMKFLEHFTIMKIEKKKTSLNRYFTFCL